jgi:tyrosyl-tRNA synthetase
MRHKDSADEIERKLEEVEMLLSRGVEKLIDPEGLFKQKLTAKVKGEYKKDIVVKFGVDPTRPDIHLGTAVGLRKLRKFQELGCKIVFLIGDFTAQIGDPTEQSKVRPDLDQKKVEENMMTYLNQIGKILLLESNTFSWIRNSDWFLSPEDLAVPEGAKINLTATIEGKQGTAEIPANSFFGKALYFENSRMQKTHMGRNEVHTVTLRGFLWTLKHFTHSRLIERDMFSKRIATGGELFMHEMVYPVLQGVDSYVLARIYGSCDVEIGGTDQLFNMLVGRTVMKANNMEEQSVLAFGLLEGTDGVEKMSKSLDNYIGITDPPGDMYGKIMSIKDSSILNYFKLAALSPLDDIKKIEQLLKTGKNPRDIKMRLAREIVSLYHGEHEALKAEEAFVSVFQMRNTPLEIEKISCARGELLSDVLVRGGVVASKTEFRRLVESGSIKKLPSEEKLNDPFSVVRGSEKLKIGKRRFVEIVAAEATI